ncbi:MAG: FAD-dependent oxidoreductase [Bacteroidota bacterium]|nr:FAD-dependent oxidoreductase [Bacteroidota bacterium]
MLNLFVTLMNKKVIIIGAGAAGMETAVSLSKSGHHVTLIEKESKLGGHLLQWDRLFPNRRPASDVVNYLKNNINGTIETINNTLVNHIEKNDGRFVVETNHGHFLDADAIVVTTGFEVFDARKKEEYGYGIYNNVLTSADLERLFKEGKPLLTNEGNSPKRIGFIHCVGSRDQKAGHLYCSQVCCVTGVKQAIEVKEMLPEAEVFSFYMDLRMFDKGFEALYREAQEKYGVNFIRGRLSEACENNDGSILLKVEDTLAGRPMKMSVDLLVLLVGFVPAGSTADLANMLGMSLSVDGFLEVKDDNMLTTVSPVEGVFLAGACCGPKTIACTLNEARSAALKVNEYLREKN